MHELLIFNLQFLCRNLDCYFIFYLFKKDKIKVEYSRKALAVYMAGANAIPSIQHSPQAYPEHTVSSKPKNCQVWPQNQNKYICICYYVN